MTININDLTLGQINKLKGLFDGENPTNTSSETNLENPTNTSLAELANKYELKTTETNFVIGKNYLIRTVTMIQVGKLVKVNTQELVLQKAGWIADTGKFSECLGKGKISEIEMFPAQCDVIVGRGALIDACEWINELPTETK